MIYVGVYVKYAEKYNTSRASKKRRPLFSQRIQSSKNRRPDAKSSKFSKSFKLVQSPFSILISKQSKFSKLLN